MLADMALVPCGIELGPLEENAILLVVGAHRTGGYPLDALWDCEEKRLVVGPHPTRAGC